MIMLIITKVLLTILAFTLLQVAIFAMLRVFDKALGLPFKETFGKLSEDSKALALYLGLRILGVSLAASLVLCFSLIL